MNKPRRTTDFRLGPLAILAISIAALYFARQLFIPLAFAITLTLLLTPLVTWLQKLRVPRVPAVFIAMLLALSAVIGAGWLVVDQLVQVANQLPNYRENIRGKIAAMSTPSKGALGRAAESVKEIGTELAAPPDPGERAPAKVQVVQPLPTPLESVRDLVHPFLAPIGMGFIVLIFTAFMLIKREDLRNRVLRLVGLGQLNVMTQALDDAAQRVSKYLFMQLLVNACFGALFGAGLDLIGVPYAALWGVTAAIFRIVPYAGTTIAALLPITMSLAVFNGWTKPAEVFGIFIVLEVLTANVVEPLLYGAQTGVSSLAILISTVFWATLWGPAGLILATPLTVCVAVLGRYVPQLSFLHILLGDEPVLAAEAQLYQRLLALDQQEARAIVDLFLKGRTLQELYDQVMIPALIMAEQDRHKGALDTAREDFLFLSLSEMVAEFATYRPPDAPPKAALEPREGRALCLPASDTADEISAAMLSQLLEQAGFAVVTFPAGESFHDLLPWLNPEAHDVICISALPPFAFASARDLCRLVRTRFPHVPIVVGIWGFSGDTTEALQRFEHPGPNHITATLSGTVEFLGELQNSTMDLLQRQTRS